MSYSVLAEARVQGSVADLAGANRPYSVYWAENKNLQGWTTFVNLDIVGAWNGFLFGTKTSASGGFIGPTLNFPVVDAQVNDHIFFRMKYDKHPKNVNPTTFGKIQWITTADATFNDTKSFTFEVIPDGKWHLYDLDMNTASQWVGNITRVRFFPCENGFRNDEFFLNFFEIGTVDFSFSLDNSRAGLPGRVIGDLPLNQDITIEKDVNDHLIVNIDGYGDVSITLTPQTAQPSAIARDISLQLGKVAIGGYVRAQARIDADNQKLIIESGIKAADSSVVVKYGPNSAAPVLGLTNVVGEFIGITEAGVSPAFDYVPLASYTPKTLELFSLFDNDSALPAFGLDPQVPVVEGGRRNFGLTGRRLETEIVIEGRGTNFQGQTISTIGSLSGSATTFIDLNHPFTDDGVLSEIFFNGIANTSGGTKWKIFRPSLNGTLTLVTEGVIGQTTITPNPSGGLVLTTSPGVFRVDVSTQNIKVRRGDLLGIYNASFHIGQAGTLKADALYYSITGDVQGTITPPTPSGAGEQGLPIYAVGSVTKTRAAIDIDLGRRLNLDKIRILGQESSRDLEYNLASAASAVFSIDVLGSHTICYVIDTIFNIRDCFSRNNAAFNVQALNDDIIYAENGITSFGSPGVGGAGGATVAGATYFYVNGDAEHLGIYEFVNLAPKSYDFFRDPLGITCFFSSTTPRMDKPVGKAIMYFKDRKNQRSWQIEFSRGDSSSGNGSIPGFQLIPEESIQSVTLDDSKKIENFAGFFVTQKQGLQNILLRNPVLLDVIAADGTRNPQIGVDFTEDAGELGGVNFREQATFLEFQWSKFQWEFEAVRTPAFRWYSDFHWSTKISEMQIFGVSASNESLGDNTQVLFSADGETFASAALISSTTTQAEYRLGNSPQYLRLIFRPTLDLTLKDVQIDFEEDQICFGPEGRTGNTITIEDSVRGSVGQATVLPITNSTSQTADLILDLPSDVDSARQLLYFSQLHSIDDVMTPQVGPPGRVDFVSDKVLKEEDNVAINATAYGLKNLTTTNSPTQTNNLLLNSNFEFGNLTNWSLLLTQSGTKSYQQPRVMDVTAPTNFTLEGPNPDESLTPEFQSGNYLFGFEMDTRLINQDLGTSSAGPDEVPIHFTLESIPIDVSEYAELIDTGACEFEMSFNYMAYFTPSTSPIVNVMGSPTTSGIALAENSVVDATYGTNRLRRTVFIQGENNNAQTGGSNQIVVSSWKARVKSGTRFIKIQFVVNATGARVFGGSVRTQKFFLDAVNLHLILPDSEGVKWYKSWRTGAGDFTDAQFSPVTEFIATRGSTHWWQPWNITATSAPVGGQTQGFSNAFLSDRLRGIQSFRRMRHGDPGILAAKWSGEKTIHGFRIVLNHNVQDNALFSCAYARSWHVEVLKTKAELGGIDPDLNNDAHYNQIVIYRNTGPWAGSNTELRGMNSSNFQAPAGLITTWLFDTPQVTEGMKIVITTNCDLFEIPPFDTNSSGAIEAGELAAFTAATSCPENSEFTTAFLCTRGIGASFFQPLEVAGLTLLPVDNVKEGNFTGNVFAAVDLGRQHNIETNSDLFELVAETVGQTEWNTAGVSYSSTNTSNPNAVVWGGGTANARWIRFSTASTVKYEDPQSLEESTSALVTAPAVINLPQSRLLEARVYPNLTQTLLPVHGLNSTWINLGSTISDNDNSTFVSYRDYPVICLDLGKAYLLSNESTLLRKKHDFVTPTISLNSDRAYWNPTDDTNFTYSTHAFSNQDDPRQVEFSAYGTAPPNFAVRWVAFKGDGPLQQAGNVTGPKAYNFGTPGQTLYQSNWGPRNPEILTQNSNWFSTQGVGLNDISTFDTTQGYTFSATKGVDYGPADGRDNIGDVYNAFDGQFDEFRGDVWGVEVRDPTTFLNDPLQAFPHHIFRLFRDLFRGGFPQKEIKAIKIRGYNEAFYPTDFTLQKLKDSIVLSSENTPTAIASNANALSLSTSWENIEDDSGVSVSFTGVDTFQDGFGFIHIFPTPVTTRGIRIVVNDSVYPDDSVQTQTSDTGTGTYSTAVDTSGPQTRVSEVVIYEEVINSAVLTGILDIDHAFSSSVTSLTHVPEHEAALMVDGQLDTFWQSTGFIDTITIPLTSVVPISRLEWDLDPTLGQATGNLSTNAPTSFTLSAFVGGQYIPVVTATGFVGTSFSGTLAGSPVSSNLFKLEVSEVQGQDENASSIQISELRLIEEHIQLTPLVTIEEVIDRHPDSTNITSTLIRYAPNADAMAEILLDGIDANNDADWSERDFFQFYLKINDVNLLDTNVGTIKLGNSEETSYIWNIKDIPNLQSGWNRIRLQFKSAADRSAVPFQGGPNFNPNFEDSAVDFLTPDVEVQTNADGVFSARVIESPGIRFFSMEFRGTKADPTRELQLTLDDFRFSRNRFDDVCKFGPSLYLNNSEIMSINLEGLDISVGTVEFWMQPDWDKSARLRSRPTPPGGTIIPAIFRIIRPDGTFLALFYRPNTGFVVMIYDGEQLLQFENDNRSFDFERFESFHFALVWDTISRKASASNSTLVMYVNGEPIYGTSTTWRAVKQGGTSVFFGGEMGQRLAASPHNSTALAFTAVPTLPAKNTQSMWALLENVKIYNYPKLNFDDRFEADLTNTQLLTPSTFVEISVDGVNFEGVGSNDLPLVVPGVPSEGTVNVYLRTNLPRHLTGEESRDASVIVRWKTPLRECD